MLIICRNCATSHRLEPDSLGQDGLSLRCESCRSVWLVTAPTTAYGLAGSDEWDLVETSSLGSVDRPAQFAAFSAGIPADFAAPEDIDVADLDMDVAAELAEGETETDEAPAEVMQETTMVDSPALVPIQAAALPETEPRAAWPDIESLAARRARRDAPLPRRRFKPGLSAAVLALLALNAGLLAWRADIVRLLPQTASLYAVVGLPVNLRGLSFENLRMFRSEHEGVGVLVVEGSIVNVTKRPVEVPQLRLAMHNDAKHEIYAWTMQPPRSILGPGDALPFRSRLASPPADARVQVRFFRQRDVVAELN